MDAGAVALASRVGREEIDVLAKPCPSELAAPINPERGVEGHRNLF